MRAGSANVKMPMCRQARSTQLAVAARGFLDAIEATIRSTVSGELAVWEATNGTIDTALRAGFGGSVDRRRN